ncbi:MAG: hypothetical protein KBT68_08535 [bacterium]|nr:hypothetical protein [Candidatus Colisoma equi]
MKERLVALFVSMASVCAFADMAKVGVVVIDEETQDPIEGATVKGWFQWNIGWRAWSEPTPIVTDTKITDKNGFCRLGGKTNVGEVGVEVQRIPGKYYSGSCNGFEFKRKNIFGVWQPDNLVATISLQRVEHPIPLCVKNVRPKVAPGTFDGTNAVLRYDFVLGDWLPPEGKGERADLEIRTKLTIDEVLQVGRRRKKVFFEFRNEIEFTGEGNGCCAEMIAPTMGIKLRNAPEVGYGKTIVNRFGVKRKIVGPNVNEAEYSDSNPNRCYYFRIRSRFDDKGNLVEAYYGKIYGDFNFHGDWSYGFQGFDFLCYLNPTSLDRNLEWDMKTNLCPNPGSLGQLQP